MLFLSLRVVCMFDTVGSVLTLIVRRNGTGTEILVFIACYVLISASVLQSNTICVISFSPTNTSPPLLLPFILYLCVTSPVAGQTPEGNKTKPSGFSGPILPPHYTTDQGKLPCPGPSPSTALLSLPSVCPFQNNLLVIDLSNNFPQI